MTVKIELVMKAKEMKVPIISSMGAGNKLDPSAFRVADIYKTKMCPLAKVMRRELKQRGVKKLKVVYSEEKPTRPLRIWLSAAEITASALRKTQNAQRGVTFPGSVAFVPSVIGLIPIAGRGH